MLLESTLYYKHLHKPPIPKPLQYSHLLPFCLNSFLRCLSYGSTSANLPIIKFFFRFSLTGNVLITDSDLINVALAEKKEKDRDKKKKKKKKDKKRDKSK